MEDWFILVMIVLVASLLQTSTGYGFSIIGTPILLLLYPAHTAIQINMILSLCLSIVMYTRIGKQTDKPLLFRLMKGSGAGLAAGLLVYLYMDMRWISIFVGGLILLLTVLLIGKITVQRTNSRDLATGGISGLLTTSIGVPGPPLLLYFSGTGMDKSILRSTTLVYNLFSSMPSVWLCKYPLAARTKKHGCHRWLPLSHCC